MLLQHWMQTCPASSLGRVNRYGHGCCSKRHVGSNHCQSALEQGIEPSNAQGSVSGCLLTLYHLSLRKCACACVFVCSKLRVFVITVRHEVHRLLLRFKGAAVFVVGRWTFLDISEDCWVKVRHIIGGKNET